MDVPKDGVPASGRGAFFNDLDIEIDYVLGTILDVTRKHDFGAGKIAVLPVDDVIRTGESGAKAVF